MSAALTSHPSDRERGRRITSTVVGMSRAERVAQTLELARHPIPEEIWPRLDAVGFDVDDPEANRFVSS